LSGSREAEDLSSTAVAFSGDAVQVDLAAPAQDPLLLVASSSTIDNTTPCRDASGWMRTQPEGRLSQPEAPQVTTSRCLMSAENKQVEAPAVSMNVSVKLLIREACLSH
jgi:hypothetical protein